MVAFLRWLKAIALGTLNGIARFAFVLVLLFFGLFLIGLVVGDGMPKNMVLSLDLRQPLRDSAPRAFSLFSRPLTLMDIVLGLDAAEHDSRVKGVILRVGNANLPIAQAEEIGAALKKFRKSGRFVIAHSQGFNAPGLGDYLTAASADEIWMQPRTPFGAAGEGGGELFLRGLLDKIDAVPQIAKRADYKSAADMYMEKNMTPADREQITALMQSWYGTATADAAADRRISPKVLAAAFDASPQFGEDVRKIGVIDKIGYDDDALDAALGRAGSGAKAVPMTEFVRSKETMREIGNGTRIAVVEGSGEIVEGTDHGGMLDGSDLMAGDDISHAIRQAAQDSSVKAIVLRVDSPGGSVSASDQILDAVKKAQARGIPVVVSMGSVAASGGYYISTSADRIVAEPGTITGSIGVLTGKVALGKSLQLLGVGTDEVGVGKNALMDSALVPYTPEQWAALNAQADAIYADFKQKVSAGRKLPPDKVQELARGRVWSGSDASSRGLVDSLGGFWTAVDTAKRLAKIAPDAPAVLKEFPRQRGFFESLSETFGGSSASMRALQGLVMLMNTPAAQTAVHVSRELPRGGVEMRVTNLPH
ncbi:MAG: signal peptide peptidase SppA [Alphaproteobacteria bacterium]|nr:signal peptide peptidase SppA [Alphaproteobacteria bacterium]MBV9692335.1 signal peptide peptidase SppA [Alphaproteobacteria bacterium]